MFGICLVFIINNQYDIIYFEKNPSQGKNLIKFCFQGIPHVLRYEITCLLGTFCQLTYRSYTLCSVAFQPSCVSACGVKVAAVHSQWQTRQHFGVANQLISFCL